MSDPTPDPEAIAEALREATPGPWEVRNNGRRATVNAACDQHAMCERTGAIIAKVGEVGDDPLPDAHLIANAPTWLAQLLAALEAKDGELERLREALMATERQVACVMEIAANGCDTDKALAAAALAPSTPKEGDE